MDFEYRAGIEAKSQGSCNVKVPGLPDHLLLTINLGIHKFVQFTYDGWTSRIKVSQEDKVLVDDMREEDCPGTSKMKLAKPPSHGQL